MAQRRTRIAVRRSLVNKSKAKRFKIRSADVRSADASLRSRRVGLLYGLTGLFGVVVVGLLLARPRPLRAQDEIPHVALLATAGQIGGIDPLDIALQTGNGAKPGNWTGVTVLTLTTSQARAAHAHFKVVLDNDESGQAPQVIVGQEWLQQASISTNTDGNFVLVVVVDDHEREVRHEATVVALVGRLCERLRIDSGHVNWS